MMPADSPRAVSARTTGAIFMKFGRAPATTQTRTQLPPRQRSRPQVVRGPIAPEGYHGERSLYMRGTPSKAAAGWEAEAPAEPSLEKFRPGRVSAGASPSL